jgi:hypothetical protein
MRPLLGEGHYSKDTKSLHEILLLADGAGHHGWSCASIWNVITYK